jgi:predicted nuclease of predicted toxin-antitoxin system
MKFLIDAQLPRRLSHVLTAQGHDSIHTLDLPNGNRTSDGEIGEISVAEARIVISKDADFVNDFLLKQQPYGLLLVSTGNIANNDLLQLITKHLDVIVSAFENARFVELTREAVIIHQ